MSAGKTAHYTKLYFVVELNDSAKKRIPRVTSNRAQSKSPVFQLSKNADQIRKYGIERRCQSLSPSTKPASKSLEPPSITASAPVARVARAPSSRASTSNHGANLQQELEKEPSLPQCVVAKIMRNIAIKKREFIKQRKSLITQQNSLLEHYASIKEMEDRTGTTQEDTLGEVRVLSVTTWPAHDLLLLVRDDLEMPFKKEISGLIGPQVLQQLNAQLSPIPEDVLRMGTEIIACRVEILNLVRGKHTIDRATRLTSTEWKTKNTELDQETEKLHRLVAGTAENLRAKIDNSLKLARIPWVDREGMTKKIERLQKDNMILQHKLEEATKKECGDTKESEAVDSTPAYQSLSDELTKERVAREALKEVVTTAEGMLRVARARISTLERQLKEARADLDTAHRKHKDLEQLYRHRETSYDARSKKLIEVSKTGEITIEALSRQRDALELRVKELREQAEMNARVAEKREVEQRARSDSLQAKAAEQEKSKTAAEGKVKEMEKRVKEMEEQLSALRESSARLVEMERKRCLQYVPSKENEPSDRETDIWKELQVTRVALSRAEEQLRQSRADKDNFLKSLSRIAQGEGADNIQDKMATELLDREQKVAKLQLIIEEQRQNEKLMKQTMTQYENQLASLRLEIKRLRNYDCYSKEISNQELQTELLEMHMRVETLSRERTALMTAAASRALMLERHERSAELFARMTRARRELAALLDGSSEPPALEEATHAEVTRSLSSMCGSAADTWNALRAERARVLRLESAVLAQSLQLEREGRVRTQLEWRRALLEQELMRAQNMPTQDHSSIGKNPNYGHFLA